MGALSVRIPDDMEAGLKEVAKEERLEQPSEAARKVLSIGLERWQQERALHQLAEGKVSFSKAAQLARMNVWDFAKLVKEKKITWVTDAVIREDIEMAKV